jgi:thioredoxin-like negative regulator of GroEL
LSTLPSLALLLLSAAGWAAEPAPTWSDEARALLDAPRDAAALAALASALGETAATEEDAAAAYRRLLARQPLTGALEDDLMRMVLTRPVRAGWRDLYLALAAASKDPDEVYALKLKAAAARVVAGEGKAALADVKALAGARADREDAALLLSHAALAAGDAAGARAALDGRARTREAREALLLASFAAGAKLDEAWWRKQLAGAGWAPEAIDAVAQGDAAAAMRAAFLAGPPGAAAGGGRQWLLAGNPDLVAAAAAPGAARPERARALLAYGYQDLAIGVLKEADPAGPAASEIAATRWLLGTVLLRGGDAAGALARFDEGLAKVPDDPALLLAKGSALISLGRLADAAPLVAGDAAAKARLEAAQAQVAAKATPSAADDLVALRAAWAANPTDLKLSQELGAQLLKADQKRDALDPLEAAVRARPSDAAAVAAFVNAAVEVGAAERAIAAARLGLAAARTDGDRARLVGSLQYGWVKRAEELRAAQEVDRVVDAYGVSHLLNPEDLGIFRALGGALWGAGRTEEAWASYLDVFRLSPKDPDGLNALSALSIQLGREDELRQMLAPYADDATVRKVLRELELREALAEADALLRSGDVKGAYDRYLRLQARDPSNADVVRGLASVKLAEDDVEGALELFRQARAMDGDSPWSRMGEANALLAAGEIEVASQILDELEGTADVALRQEISRARVRLLVAQGKALSDAGDDQGAWKAYAKALELGPDTWVCHNLASLYAKHRQYDVARAFYDEAFYLDGTNVYARLGKASLQVELGWLEEAEAILDTLPADNADVAAARRSLEVTRAVREADVARRIGETAEARRIIQAVYEKYPGDPAAEEAWKNEVLESGTPEEVLAAARGFLIKDVLDERALGAALRASHNLGTTDIILPIFEAAAAKGGPAHTRWLNRARIAAGTEKGIALHEQGRHDDAAGMIGSLEERAGQDATAWDILGGAWLEIRETKRALDAYDKALLVDPRDNGALVGKAGALSTQGKARDGIAVLEEAWQRDRDPEIGLALAEQYRAARQLKQVDRVLTELEGLGPMRPPVDPLPVLELPSGRAIEPIEAAPQPLVLAPSMEARRRVLRESSPAGGWLPGFDVGAGIYSRPGRAGQQFLTAFFTPVRLHELRAGPVAFDVEAVPYFLSDFEDEQYGAQVTGGIQAGVGPMGLHVRGGVSPLGFSSKPYFIWFGSLDVRASDQVTIGVVTSREPITDSLTSWAGKLARNGEVFGRVHRTGIGGYLNIAPTKADRVSLYGRGGWNEGLQMERAVPFWEASLSGGHDFTWGLFDLRVGGIVLGMSFADQVDKFRPGQGGFFSPELFVMGAGKVEGRVHTRNEKLRACVGTNLGAQYIQAEYTEGTDDYIRPGVYFGYNIAAALDWRMARYWWLGVDYGRTVTGTTWRQDIAMVHLHFGPNDSWDRQKYPVYSPLAGQPVVQSQPCGN